MSIVDSNLISNKARSRLLALVILSSIFTQNAVIADEITKKRVVASAIVEAVPVTGFNSFLGSPRFNFGSNIGDLSFSIAFEQNPNGSEPYLLSTSTPGDAILATGADPKLFNLLGIPIESVDASFVNAPFHKFPIITNGLNAGREVLPSALQSPATSVLALPHNTITLDRWLKAKALAKIRCYSDGSADIKIKYHNLIENALYASWAVFSLDLNQDGVEDNVRGFAFGGVPNLVMTDAEGSATLERNVAYCPMTEQTLKIIDLQYHVDGAAYGGAPATYAEGFPGNLSTIPHLVFKFHGVELQ